jgi:peptidyl-prolyl cis-trans isomerase A (cyclophilin A)
MKQVKYLCCLLICFGCQRAVFKEKWVKEKAPAHFKVLFETSKGNMEAEFTRAWSPLAVDRVYAQIKHGFYNHTLFYRVRPNYVAQFGVDDSIASKKWGAFALSDEPVLEPNVRGTISYARSGKNTRGDNLYINLKNNSPRLDTLQANGVVGYPVLGKITQGVGLIDSLYSGYGDQVFDQYRLLFKNKKAFLDLYPKLDSIKKISIIK